MDVVSLNAAGLWNTDNGPGARKALSQEPFWESIPTSTLKYWTNPFFLTGFKVCPLYQPVSWGYWYSSPVLQRCFFGESSIPKSWTASVSICLEVGRFSPLPTFHSPRHFYEAALPQREHVWRKEETSRASKELLPFWMMIRMICSPLPQVQVENPWRSATLLFEVRRIHGVWILMSISYECEHNWWTLKTVPWRLPTTRYSDVIKANWLLPEQVFFECVLVSPAQNLLGFILVVKLLSSNPVGDLVLFCHDGWDVGSLPRLHKRSSFVAHSRLPLGFCVQTVETDC